MTKTLVFKSRKSGNNIGNANKALNSLSLRPAQEIGRGNGLFEVGMYHHSRLVVTEVMKHQGFDLVEMSEGEVNALKVNHVADCVALLADALRGNYQSDDSPHYTFSDVRHKIDGALTDTCSGIPANVLAPALEAAANAMRQSAKQQAK